MRRAGLGLGCTPLFGCPTLVARPSTDVVVIFTVGPCSNFVSSVTIMNERARLEPSGVMEHKIEMPQDEVDAIIRTKRKARDPKGIPPDVSRAVNADYGTSLLCLPQKKGQSLDPVYDSC